MKWSKGIFRVQAGLIVGLLVYSLVPVSVVNAAADSSKQTVTESLLISPVNKRYQFTAGETKTDTLEVVNDGRNEYAFTTYARPYSVNDEDYVPDFTSKAQNADAYRWIQFEKSTFRLKPGQTIKVNYTIRVPANATPGGHYGVIFAETQPVEPTSGIAILRKKRVGSIIYVSVKGDTTLSGSLKSTSVPFFQSTPPLTTYRRVENTGNTDFQVHTKINVTDAFGTGKYKLETDHTVLPNTTRLIKSEWTHASWLGLYKVELTTKFLDTEKSSSHYVLLMPLWIYLLIGVLVGGRVIYALAQRKR